VNCEETDEPIEIPFGGQTRVRPRNLVLDEARDLPTGSGTVDREHPGLPLYSSDAAGAAGATTCTTAAAAARAGFTSSGAPVQKTWGP